MIIAKRAAPPDPFWDASFEWLCKQRQAAPPNADVWHLRWKWSTLGPELHARVKAGAYLLSPMLLCGRTPVMMWSAQDALVLKWVALRAESLLPRPERCLHLRGRGVRLSLQEVSTALRSGHWQFVHRTDIRGYYEHIQKKHVMNLVNRFVTDPVLAGLIEQYVYYSVEHKHGFNLSPAGIPRGCALSPLIGGALLWYIDGHFSGQPDDQVFYARYMDDFLFLTHSRWRLRRCIRTLHAFFENENFEQHPDKTQTGRPGRGFDWLGIWFSDERPTIAPRALENHRQHRVRLYEQTLRNGLSPGDALARVHAYEKRWGIWADSMLQACLPTNLKRKNDE